MKSRRISWPEIGLLYRSEVRAALRERGIVVQSLLVPLALYPVILWLLFTAMTFVRGQQDAAPSRLVLDGLPAAQAELRTRLADDERFELVEIGEVQSGAVDGVREGAVDLVVHLRAAAASTFIADNFVADLTYDAARERSATARQRFEAELETYRSERLEAAGLQRGVGADTWRQVRIERESTASDVEMGAYVLGLIVPMLMVLMIAMGCVMPAIDTTAGERERSTWETLLTMGVARTSIVAAKYLYVATFGTLAGLLNLVALSLSLGALLSALGGGDALEVRLPLAALPLIALGSVLLALFIAAGMMLLAAFARSFKEAQSMTGPFLLLVMLPVFLTMAPDLHLDARWALVPIANVVLLFRDAIGGVYHPGLIALVLGAQALAAALVVQLARWVFGFEDVFTGSYAGSLFRLLKQRLRARPRIGSTP
ncbi:MAG: ABC transporter permease [Acidobacteriota bacterium]